ncbi:MAG: hypothetical protein FWF77_01540 [Defluviitaleaceae bacterium]|nr:hypothetical protein [Defluviitaleaceae bacterium]
MWAPARSLEAGGGFVSKKIKSKNESASVTRRLIRKIHSATHPNNQFNQPISER